MKNPRRGYLVRTLIFLALLIGFLYLDRLAITFMMPAIMPDLQLTNFQVGQINLTTTLFLAISGIIFGMVADKTGKRKFWLALLSILTSIFAGLCIFATSFETLFLFRALVGIAEGPLLALTYTMIGHEDPEHYGLNIGIIAMTIGICANILGPVMVTQLISVVDWQWTFLLSAIPGFIVSLCILKWVKEVEISPEEREKSKAQNIAQFLQIFKYRNLVICVIIGMLHMTAYWIVLVYGPLYLTKVVGQSVEKMGVITSLAGLLVFPWTLIMPLTDKVGRKPVLYLAYFFCIIPFLGIILGGGSTVTIVLYVVFAMLPAVFTPIWSGVIPTESLPERLQVSSSTVVIAAGDIVGGAIMSAAAGKIADIYGLTSIFIIGAVCMAACFLLVFALKESNPKLVAKKDALVAANL
ncbi:MAG: MFS transporter [Spirochaetes bacterium]|nr:MFS transporter [Spirochaetota bacterium]